jgi:Tetracyclin repressor-like, C-terminal domain
MLRYVWVIEPLVSMTDNEAVDHIAPTIQRYIDGPLRQRAPNCGRPTRQRE